MNNNIYFVKSVNDSIINYYQVKNIDEEKAINIFNYGFIILSSMYDRISNENILEEYYVYMDKNHTLSYHINEIYGDVYKHLREK